MRSLSSSVFRWPDASKVDQAVQEWAQNAVQNRQDVNRIGYFGSYARGDWGVGSDLDIIVILDQSTLPFEQRSLKWNTLKLPVPTDLLIYTVEEWEAIIEAKSRFSRMLQEEVIWVYPG